MKARQGERFSHLRTNDINVYHADTSHVVYICLPEIQAISLLDNAQSLAASGEMRGVFVTLGWNVDCMLFQLRVGSVYTLVGLATNVISLGSVLRAGYGGD